MLQEHIPVQPTTKLQAVRQRIYALYQQGAVYAQSDGLLGRVFEELAYLLEELPVAYQMLHRQREESLNREAAQELEIQRYLWLSATPTDCLKNVPF